MYIQTLMRCRFACSWLTIHALFPDIFCCSHPLSILLSLSLWPFGFIHLHLLSPCISNSLWALGKQLGLHASPLSISTSCPPPHSLFSSIWAGSLTTTAHMLQKYLLNMRHNGSYSEAKHGSYHRHNIYTWFIVIRKPDPYLLRIRTLSPPPACFAM